MKALVLAAGQGKRLLPLTADTPKSLLGIAGQEILVWQVQEFVRAGIDEIVVVTGFNAAMFTPVLELCRTRWPGVAFREVHNPFFSVSDNLASCWIARHEMVGEFILVNGDTLFDSEIVARLLDSRPAPVTLCVDRKEHYDDDDMKVRAQGSRLREIGKTLPADTVNAESIGLMLFRGQGPGLFVGMLDRMIAGENGLRQWYLSAIGALAREHEVRTCAIHGLAWQEVDYPLDLARAGTLVADWHDRPEVADPLSSRDQAG